MNRTSIRRHPPDIDDVRALAAPLLRSYEVLVHDRVKFRVGRIVWVAFSRDETRMGFAFPREERAAQIEAEPDKFFLPRPSELRYNWVESHLDRLDRDELAELIHDAWRMVVPKRVAAAYFGDAPSPTLDARAAAAGRIDVAGQTTHHHPTRERHSRE